MNPHYCMIIQWSEEDRVFVVSFPELADLSQPCTHGETYEQAARSGREVLELVIEDYRARGKPLPEPRPATAGSA